MAEKNRDEIIIKFRKYIQEQQLKESVGGYLKATVGELEDVIKTLKGGSDDITSNDISTLLRLVGTLEANMKKILKGKGLIGW